MFKIKIDKKYYQANSNQTILDVCRKNNIYVPTLCYLKDINDVGACRLCVVELEGNQSLVSACNTKASEGMVINTKSKRVLEARKVNLSLILEKHHTDCKNCKRNNSCKLQSLAKEFGLYKEEVHEFSRRGNWSYNLPLIKDESKCIQCYRCINTCEKIQSMGVWSFNGSGEYSKVEVKNGLKLNEVNCVLCGQCITHCPTNALSERDDVDKVLKAINDKDIITVMQIAPAVRTAFGEQLNIKNASERKLVGLAKSLGVDYVFDTNFAADLTIMEEGSELVEFLNKRKNDLPMFTSCCPGWVRFVKYEYPQLVNNLSSAKSPQQMFGAVAKSYFAKAKGIDKKKICCISIMPCLAKKYEADVKEVSTASDKDVDYVLTTREFIRLFNNIDISKIKEADFDSPLGESSGAGVIFGSTGGVMEAALRSAYYLVNGKNTKAESFDSVRANKADPVTKATWRSNEFKLTKDKTLKVAVASGLNNARSLINAILNKEVQYDFVEIMACPGGCVGGGGQPIKDGEELAFSRAKKLYKLDKQRETRFSHQNTEIINLYNRYLDKPLSNKAHKLLHTKQKNWEL